MANRSTRNKLRWQVGKVIEHLVKAQGHFQFLDEMAGGESSYINDNIPVLVDLIDEMIKTCNTFREGL